MEKSQNSKIAFFNDKGEYLIFDKQNKNECIKKSKKNKEDMKDEEIYELLDEVIYINKNFQCYNMKLKTINYIYLMKIYNNENNNKFYDYLKKKIGYIIEKNEFYKYILFKQKKILDEINKNMVEEKKDNDETECYICYEHNKNFDHFNNVLNSCIHKNICKDCLLKVIKNYIFTCPFCRNLNIYNENN